MMNAAIELHRSKADLIERVVIQGDLSRLTAAERSSYYANVCESLGLNPLTRPFEYLKLNGREILYARRDCTDQLRKVHNVSITIVSRERSEDLCIVTARALLPSGRCDESTGAVTLKGLTGENLANALMKAETKAKRRATLSICGLAFMDETEVEAVREAIPLPRISPHVELDESPDDVAPNDDAFDGFMLTLVTVEAEIDHCADYDTVLKIREVLGTKAKMSRLTKAMQTASEARAVSPQQRKELGALWQRLNRKTEKLEATIKPPSAEDAFRDETDEKTMRQPGED